MKIKTERNWDLEFKQCKDYETKENRDYVEIIEHHNSSEEEDYKPYVCIPLEAVDEIVLQLLKFKKRLGNGKE